MSHSCVQIYLHVIFSTKDRKPLISKEIENLHGYLRGIAKEHQIEIIQINGTDDHVHLLLKLNAKIALGTLIKELKAYSSGWMKKVGYKDFSWQEGYGAFSCSINHIPRLINYIKNQKEHHKSVSFQDELLRLCKFWGVKWYAGGVLETEGDNGTETSNCPLEESKLLHSLESP